MLNQYRATNCETGEVIEGIIKDIARHICVTDCTARNAARNGAKVAKVWTVERIASKKGFDKICDRCGKQFYGCRHDVRYCSDECLKEATKDRAKELRQIRHEAKRVRREKQQSITQIAIKARQAGMTYGQYVAKMGL